MIKMTLLALVLAVLFPNLVRADCVEFGGFNNRYMQDEHTVILYQGTAYSGATRCSGRRCHAVFNHTFHQQLYLAILIGS